MLILTELIGEATVQAGPCPDRRRFGVPTGGAFDPISLAIANQLVVNPADAAGIEFTLATATFIANGPISFALVGASGNQRVLLKAGESYQVTPNITGARTYLAVPGGIHLPSGTRILAPTEIAVHGPHAYGSMRLANVPPSFTPGPIRVVAGPQASSFDLAGILTAAYQVGQHSNRMGLRLSGPAWPHDISLPSEPCTPGAIQVTPDGTLIVLGPDGPTIGGYPKPLVVISADLPKLGQLIAGSPIEFRRVSLNEAQEIRRRELGKNMALLAQLQSAIESNR